ncbi:MAG: putative glycoside hydrolase, partial [Clostridiales bacterium]|nr:putative glycoside hydrolase [Clostridiales bacterium]
LNAVVVDIKEGGKVNYKSSIPFISENDLDINYYNPEKVLKKLHDNNIYVIGRIVVFRDNGLATVKPELAVKKIDGTSWKENKKKDGAWTNPYKEEVWDYNIKIAEEAINLGFDEIQFDYVRFPTAKKSEVNYAGETKAKKEMINAFLKRAKEKIHDEMGVPVSADVFGIIAESKSDGEAIGQDLDTVGLDIDYISPMVYPSHYAKGQEVNGVTFAKPDFEPYQVVLQTLLKAKTRISAVSGYNAKVRPYLQDFTASYLKKGDYQEYGAKQVREQIQAVYDAGFEEWILWDGRNTYTTEALEKDVSQTSVNASTAQPATPPANQPVATEQPVSGQ